MARNARRLKKPDRIVDILLILVMLATIYFLTTWGDYIVHAEKDIKILSSQINKDSFALKSTQLQIETEKDVLEELKNAANTKDGARNEYFALLASLEEKIINNETDLKIAYLTFDDGPYLKSPLFLDILDENNIKATFFYLKKSSENGYEEINDAYDEIYRRIIEEGHTLGNHTASHKLRSEDSVYSSVGHFMQDLLENRDFIEERYSYRTNVMRFPGGSTTSSKAPAIKERLKQEGYCYVDWNAHTGDGGAVLSPKEFTDNVLYDTTDKPILVVLMHDYSQNTLIALPDIIEGLKEQGYIFAPLFNGSIMCK